MAESNKGDQVVILSFTVPLMMWSDAGKHCAPSKRLSHRWLQLDTALAKIQAQKLFQSD